MIKLEELENGDLKIILINKEDFIEEFPNLYPEIFDLLDRSGYLGNNWWNLTDLVGLTSSPLIGYDISIDDKGNLEFPKGCKIWWFPNYMIENPFERLYNKGEVIFQNGNNL